MLKLSSKHVLVHSTCSYGGTRWRRWLRHCSTRRKVAGSFQQQSTCFVTLFYASMAKFVYSHCQKYLHRQVPLVVRYGRMHFSKFRWSFPYGLVRWLFNGSSKSRTRHRSRCWSTDPRRIFHIPVIKGAFLPRKMALCTEMASQIAAERVPSPDSSSDLCCLFIHPHTRYQMLLSGIIANICHCQRPRLRIRHRIPVGARFSAGVQTGPGAHPTSYTMGIGSFCVVQRPERGVTHSLPSRRRG
jgi:hypothetical protein